MSFRSIPKSLKIKICQLNVIISMMVILNQYYQTVLALNLISTDPGNFPIKRGPDPLMVASVREMADLIFSQENDQVFVDGIWIKLPGDKTNGSNSDSSEFESMIKRVFKGLDRESIVREWENKAGPNATVTVTSLSSDYIYNRFIRRFSAFLPVLIPNSKKSFIEILAEITRQKQNLLIQGITPGSREYQLILLLNPLLSSGAEEDIRATLEIDDNHSDSNEMTPMKLVQYAISKIMNEKDELDISHSADKTKYSGGKTIIERVCRLAMRFMGYNKEADEIENSKLRLNFLSDRSSLTNSVSDPESLASKILKEELTPLVQKTSHIVSYNYLACRRFFDNMPKEVEEKGSDFVKRWIAVQLFEKELDLKNPLDIEITSEQLISDIEKLGEIVDSHNPDSLKNLYKTYQFRIRNLILELYHADTNTIADNCGNNNKNNRNTDRSRSPCRDDAKD